MPTAAPSRKRRSPSPVDPEYKALTTIQRALEPLNREAQRRVLRYISDRMDADVLWDVEHLMANMNEAFTAINEAAARYHITGFQLIGVIAEMYQHAVEHEHESLTQPETTNPKEQ